MTNVISKLITSDAAARSMQDRLRLMGFPRRAVVAFRASTPELEGKLVETGMDAKAAAAYADKIAEGNVVLVVSATYKPLGAARIAREIFAKARTVDMDRGVSEETYIKDRIDPTPSILHDHPHILSRANRTNASDSGPISSRFGFRLLSARKSRQSAISRGRPMSRTFWPMKLVSKARNSQSVIKGGRRMSKGFWPMPAVTQNDRQNSVIENGDLPVSRTLGWAPLSK